MKNGFFYLGAGQVIAEWTGSILRSLGYGRGEVVVSEVPARLRIGRQRVAATIRCNTKCLQQSCTGVTRAAGAEAEIAVSMNSKAHNEVIHIYGGGNDVVTLTHMGVEMATRCPTQMFGKSIHCQAQLHHMLKAYTKLDRKNMINHYSSGVHYHQQRMACIVQSRSIS